MGMGMAGYMYALYMHSNFRFAIWGKGTGFLVTHPHSANKHLCEKEKSILFWTLSSRSAPHQGNDSITVLREVGYHI